MTHTILKVCTAAAVALAVASFAAGTSAQEKKKATKAAPKVAACTTIKDEAACKARSDCNWVPATTKLKVTVRRAHCAAAPAAKKAK